MDDRKIKIAIVTRPDFRSPRILADSLKMQLEKQGLDVEISYDINFLNRLVSFRDSQLNFHFWLKRKLQHFLQDTRLLRKLKKFDAVIISECTPNGFIKRLYNVEKFKKVINKPVGFYEVYYLGNAPTKINFLTRNGDALFERFDFQLSISAVAEIRCPPMQNWYPIGINASSWNLKPLPKKELVAIIDFVHPGNEKVREVQIRALHKTGIKYICLEQPYTFEEIRLIYKRGAIYFMQSFEAFGIPILESLCCGAQIFVQESWWPMSWRLNENPQVHGEGSYPDCFTVYENEEKLVNELMAFKENYDLTETPKKVFNIFLEHYPQFYYGNEDELKRLTRDLENTVSNGG